MMRADPAVAGEGRSLIIIIRIIYTLLLLRSNPSRQQSKVLYHWVVRRRGKTGEYKNRSEEKVVGFSLASLFPALNGRQSPRVEPG